MDTPRSSHGKRRDRDCGAIRPAARRRARTSASSSRHCQIPIRRLSHCGASVQFDGQERRLRRIPDPACLPTLTLIIEEQCMTTREWETAKIRNDWVENPRWKGIKRGYSAEDVYRLRGSVQIEHTLARRGAEKLWKMCNERPFVNSLGALTGNQAMQQVKAGVPAIYLSGWQVAADANDSLSMYPDQSLYAVSSVPTVVKRINNALMRADQIQTMEAADGSATAGKAAGSIDWFAPIVADAESGFGGVLNAFELMKAMIEAGAAGVHFEDQLSSVKKCGHMGGKVLVPTPE